MPKLAVIRPADANETALAWRDAIASRDHPTALVLSRQAVPTQDPAAVPDDAVQRGAYVLREASSGEPALILLSSGTEVPICLQAAELLEADGIATRVVSMPCTEHFAAADQAYQDSVLPPGCRARVSLEAASPFGWERWVGELGEAIGMESFGASAPAAALYEHFGLTPARIADRGRAAVKRSAEA
jgi:transketolase